MNKKRGESDNQYTGLNAVKKRLMRPLDYVTSFAIGWQAIISCRRYVRSITPHEQLLLILLPDCTKKIKILTIYEIEDFIEAHLCNLCARYYILKMKNTLQL